MVRLFLVICVIAIGYDAVVHQGAYTRNAWTSLVGVTDSAVNSARNLGREVRDEPRTQTN